MAGYHRVKNATETPVILIEKGLPNVDFFTVGLFVENFPVGYGGFNYGEM